VTPIVCHHSVDPFRVGFGSMEKQDAGGEYGRLVVICSYEFSSIRGHTKRRRDRRRNSHMDSLRML